MNKRLKEWRDEKKLSQKAMAEFVGVPFSTWRNWEKGDREPGQAGLRLIHLTRIVDTFNPDLLKLREG